MILRFHSDVPHIQAQDPSKMHKLPVPDSYEEHRNKRPVSNLLPRTENCFLRFQGTDPSSEVPLSPEPLPLHKQQTAM